MHWPFYRFHTFKVLSPEAETKSLSTGENEMSHTPFLCPAKVYVSVRLLELQILIDLSCDDDAINLSFGETLTTLMYFVCPIIVILADVIS
jgi:hypothetical protein